MGTSKRERQKAGHQARLSVERAAMARYQRRRRLLTALGVFVGVVAVAGLFVVLSRSGSSSTTAATTTTTTASTTTTTLESALGKPCVALADPLPSGAPDVPVPVGDAPGGLVTEDLVAGTGATVALGDSVTVNYIGVSCSTGKIFDSSYTRGTPATFTLAEGQLIEGWTSGLPGMQVGGRRLLVIPPSLGYGSTGQGSIAPDETLVFVVDVVEAGPAPTTTTAAATTP